MPSLNGVPIIHFIRPNLLDLAGIRTVTPYRITPELRATIDSYRDAALTRNQDWGQLRQDLGADEIFSDSVSPRKFELWVRMPNSEADLDIALKNDDLLSTNPRFKNLAAPWNYRPTEADDKSAWWTLKRNERDFPADAAEGKPAGLSLFERARQIYFADKWEVLFWADYIRALSGELAKLRHPDNANFRYLIWSEEVHARTTYSNTEVPIRTIAYDEGIIFVPRYQNWEIDVDKSDPKSGSWTGRAPVAVHLQIAGAEPISYEEAFALLSQP